MKKIFLFLALVASLYAADNQITIGYMTNSMNYNEYSDTGVLLDSEVSDLNDINGIYVNYSEPPRPKGRGF